MRALSILFVVAVAAPSCSSDDAGETASTQLALAEVDYREVDPEPGIARAWEAQATYFPTEYDPDPADEDGDGVRAEADLDDTNDAVFPGAPEIPCNDQDEDGDGLDVCPPDVDGDGSRADVDCDDLDPRRGTRAPEILCNGLDENCDGQDDCDRDEDGVVDREDLDPDDPSVGSGERASAA